jgi:hypothetical protein
MRVKEIRPRGLDDTSGKHRSNDDNRNSRDNATQQARSHNGLHIHRRPMSSVLITSESAVSFLNKKYFILGMRRRYCAYARARANGENHAS